MLSNWDESFELVIRHEGGFTSDERDPGNALPDGRKGSTNLGCTQAVWEAYIGKQVTLDDMKRLTKEDVKPLYKKRYWDAIHGDRLHKGLDYAVFDTAINSGVSRASKFIQEIVGVSADGAIGNNTLLAISQFKDSVMLIDEYCEKRLAFLKALKTWPIYGRGWEKRVADVNETATRMATT